MSNRRHFTGVKGTRNQHHANNQYNEAHISWTERRKL